MLRINNKNHLTNYQVFLIRLPLLSHLQVRYVIPDKVDPEMIHKDLVLAPSVASECITCSIHDLRK